MKILVVGSGGREHAIVWAFGLSPRVSKVFCANGNAGISEIAECINISPMDIEGLLNFAEKESIDLTFVGGEDTLAKGIVNEFRKKDLRIIGATKEAAQLESSKAFAKEFMMRHGVPTAAFGVADSPENAIDILSSGKFGDENSKVVVKADGLAAGKGVVVCDNHSDAKKAFADLTVGGLVAEDASRRIVIEECLEGREISLLLFVDGNSFSLMPPTRDHKRIGENDTGPNTGGMGTITDSALLSKEQREEIKKQIILPTLEGAKADGIPFSGILFLGLMLTSDGAKVLEYNVRFGDPETQVILSALNTDFYEICEAIDKGKLDGLDVEWTDGNTACVVVAAEGYPRKPRKGDAISGVVEASEIEGVLVFHAGTAWSDSNELVTSGGRVLGVTSVADSLADALDKSYKAVNKISFKGMQFRKDIGR